MKLATWNVNSLKVRLPQVLEWAGKHRPDVLCLQETKLQDEQFPAARIGDVNLAGISADRDAGRTISRDHSRR